MKTKKLLTLKELDDLKVAAKRQAKLLGKKKDAYLDQIAVDYGHRNWSWFAHECRLAAAQASALNVAPPPEPQADSRLVPKLAPEGTLEILTAPPPHQSPLAACQAFIARLGPEKVRLLCWSGSLWINRQDLLDDTVAESSFHALGPARDAITHQVADRLDAELLMSFDGLADVFVLDDDADDGQPVEPGPDQVRYSTDVGRQQLLDILENDFEVDLENLLLEISEHADIQSAE